jgi:uncharacterized membrane protein
LLVRCSGKSAFAGENTVLAPILLAAAAAAGWGAADFLGGRASDHTLVFSVIAITELAGAIPLIPTLVTTCASGWNDRLLLAGVGGLAVTVELGVIYYALSVGAAFITAPVGALGAVLAVTAGIAGGDALSPALALALVCAILGGGISAAADAGGRGGLSRSQSIAACLLAASAIAATQITLHAAGAVDPYAATAIEHLSTAASAAILAAGIVTRGRLSSPPAGETRALPHRRRLPTLGLAALTGTGGDVAFAAAAHGPLSAVSAIASLYPIPTILLACAGERRRPSRIHTAGIVLALTGAVAIGTLSP